ncbi:hypothetical protein KIW84_061445 [Lathyrus oleraceus]|uniref:Uncharacterized protein n=1 Tax=Pisum sativum TaxID=3888 RepID=A0A9D4W2I2_PEA|nr:hypothetical protein KIW84_061445 [Pisum sativum]
MCTSTLPASRPSMKEVLKILIGCRDPQANAEKIVGIYDDAPLLKNSKWEKQVWFHGAPTNEQTVLQDTPKHDIPISPYFPSTSENPIFRLRGSLRRHPNNRPPHSPLTSEPPPSPKQYGTFCSNALPLLPSFEVEYGTFCSDANIMLTC